MTDEAKIELLKKCFEEFKNELTFDNVCADTIIERANADEAYYYKTPQEEPYETYLRNALSMYLQDWAQSWCC